MPHASDSCVLTLLSCIASKGITLFLLCRLGLATARTGKAFASAQWGIDIEPLSNAQLVSLHAKVLELFKTRGTHGGYDVVMLLLGKKAAQILTSNLFITPRPLPASMESGSSGCTTAKRGIRDWDDDGYVSADKIAGPSRKVSRQF
jgi:hypothetical protein